MLCKLSELKFYLSLIASIMSNVNFEILFSSDRFCKGVYAISVSGRLPAGVIREMKSRGIVYRPRDTSQR